MGVALAPPACGCIDQGRHFFQAIAALLWPVPVHGTRGRRSVPPQAASQVTLARRLSCGVSQEVYWQLSSHLGSSSSGRSRRAVPAPASVLRARPSSTSWDLLVQWQGQSDADGTWELLEQFKESFPDFQLEDKLFSYGEGSVVDRFFGHKFQRRKKKDASTSG